MFLGILESLKDDDGSNKREEFIDPVTGQVMRNPVVLSSGVVIDSDTALENGVLKYLNCPITNRKLTTHVYPVNLLKE